MTLTRSTIDQWESGGRQTAEEQVNSLAWQLSALLFDVRYLTKEFAKMNQIVVDQQTKITELEQGTKGVINDINGTTGGR